MTKTTEPRVASYKRLHVPSGKEAVLPWNKHHCAWAGVDWFDVENKGMPISKALSLINYWNSDAAMVLTWRYSVSL